MNLFEKITVTWEHFRIENIQWFTFDKPCHMIRHMAIVVFLTGRLGWWDWQAAVFSVGFSLFYEGIIEPLKGEKFCPRDFCWDNLGCFVGMVII